MEAWNRKGERRNRRSGLAWRSRLEGTGGFGLQDYSFMPYFLLKRSTRPALSTIFCFPV